ncbi:unnamed protein product [Schistosoma margrebowiei]|uniref:Uncharacterized protein n=1 Tax=Schistosoma margrebowiei TaxID=48269 RepID=A0A183N566_9TREM|nr:unnamed protein product [Schistosoma margrebowiei]
MSSALNPDQICDAILSDLACLDDVLISIEIVIKCEEQLQHELKSDYGPYGVASDDICFHSGSFTSVVPNERDKYIPN